MSGVGKLNYKTGARSIGRELFAVQAQMSCIGLLVLWLYFFWPTLQAMFSAYASSEAEQYCLLLPFVFLGLVLFKKKNLERIKPSNSILGVVALFALVLTWVFAIAFQEVFWQQLAIIAMVPAIFLLTSGYKVTKTLLFPFALLFLLLPVASQLVPALNAGLSKLLINTFALSKIPLLVNGNSIKFLQGNVELIAVTQGLNYVMGFFVCGAVYSYVLRLNFIRGFIVTLSFILFPYIFLLLGVHLFAKFELLTGWSMFKFFGEKLIGWGLIALSLLCSVILGGQLKQQRLRTGMEDFNWRVDVNYRRYSWIRVVAIAAAILLMVPWLAKNINNKVQLGLLEGVTYPSVAVNGWDGPLPVAKGGKATNKAKVWNQVLSAYRMQNKKVDMYAAHYPSPVAIMGLSKDSENVHDLSGWKEIKVSNKKVALTAKSTVKVIETVLISEKEHKVIWSWYNINGKNFTNRKLAEMYDGLRVAVNLETNGAIIAVSSESRVNIEQARKQLEAFLLDLSPELDKLYKS